MIGKIHFSKLGRVHVVSMNNNRVYYTGLCIHDCTFNDRDLVECDIIDDNQSIVGNIRVISN